jgi:hypothetical protein
MPPADTRLKFTREQFVEALCRVCMHPESPEYCPHIREREICDKAMRIAGLMCRKTSLENETNWGMR